MAACAALLLAACLGEGPTGSGPGITGDPPGPRPPGIVAPAIVTSALPTAMAGQPYSVTLQATGGAIPYSWTVTVGTLPAGLAMDRVNGVIAGTPTTAGTYAFDVNLATPYGAVAKNLTLDVQ